MRPRAAGHGGDRRDGRDLRGDPRGPRRERAEEALVRRDEDPRGQHPRDQDPRGQDPRALGPRGRDRRSQKPRDLDPRDLDPRPIDRRDGNPRDGDGGDAGWSEAVFGADAAPAAARAEAAPGAGRYVWIGAAIAAGVATGIALSVSPPSREWMADAAERIVTAVERRPDHQLRRLELTGHQRVSPQEVADAAASAGASDPMAAHALMLDVRSAREQIEALPWVARAEVTFRAPDRLVVRITERDAAAIWRRGRRLTLLDDAGVPIVDIANPGDRRRHWSRLPLIVGEGAAERLGEALDLAGRAEEAGLAPAALSRVGRRRWDLALLDGPLVLLPEAAPEMALETVIAWSRRADLMRRPYSRIDLRVPHAPTARRADGAAEAVQ